MCYFSLTALLVVLIRGFKEECKDYVKLVISSYKTTGCGILDNGTLRLFKRSTSCKLARVYAWLTSIAAIVITVIGGYLIHRVTVVLIAGIAVITFVTKEFLPKNKNGGLPFIRFGQSDKSLPVKVLKENESFIELGSTSVIRVFQKRCSYLEVFRQAVKDHRAGKNSVFYYTVVPVMPEYWCKDLDKITTTVQHTDGEDVLLIADGDEISCTGG